MTQPSVSVNVHANGGYEPLDVSISEFTDQGGAHAFISRRIGQIAFFVNDFDECQRIVDDLSEAISAARDSEVKGVDDDVG